MPVRDSLAFASEPVVASLANILRPDIVDQQTFTAKVRRSLFNTLAITDFNENAPCVIE